MLSPSTENSHDLRSHRNTQFIYQSFKNTINTRGMWGNQRIQSMSFSNMELSRKRNKSKQKQTNTFTPSGTGGKKWTEPSTLPTVAWTAFLFLEWFVVVCHIAGESLQGSWEPHCRQWWQSALAITLFCKTRISLKKN